MVCGLSFSPAFISCIELWFGWSLGTKGPVACCCSTAAGTNALSQDYFVFVQGGQVHYVRTYPPCWLLVACFSFPSILFPCVHLHCLAFHSWSLFCKSFFYLGKTYVLSSLEPHAVCTSAVPACISVYFQVFMGAAAVSAFFQLCFGPRHAAVPCGWYLEPGW